jgi:transposase
MEVLPSKVPDCVVTAKDDRVFIEVVLWIAQTDSPCRDLDPAIGNWHTTYTGFSRWSEKGVWQRIIATIRHNADLEHNSSTARS